MVDPEDAVLGEDRVQLRVQLAGRGEVGAERLLGDHPGGLPQPELAELAHRRFHRFRWQREIDQRLDVLAQFLARRLDFGAELLVALADAGEAQRVGEALPGLAVARLATRVTDRIQRQLAELLHVECFAGGADDPEPLGHQTHPHQVIHPRQQLALGEVAAGAEEDDHLVPRRRHRLLLWGRHHLEPMLLPDDASDQARSRL